MRKWLIAFCIMACIASGYMTLSTIYDHSSGKNSYSSIKNEVYRVEQVASEDNISLPVIDEDALRDINNEYSAWLYIPDTGIDYPVVSCDNDEKYLKLTFDKQKKSCGCLFFSHNDTGYPTIYGHNMKSGDMFGGLKKYREVDGYAYEHNKLYLYKDGEWIEYKYLHNYISSEPIFVVDNADNVLVLHTCYGKTKWLEVVWEKERTVEDNS